MYTCKFNGKDFHAFLDKWTGLHELVMAVDPAMDENTSIWLFISALPLRLADMVRLDGDQQHWTSLRDLQRVTSARFQGVVDAEGANAFVNNRAEHKNQKRERDSSRDAAPRQGSRNRQAPRKDARAAEPSRQRDTERTASANHDRPRQESQHQEASRRDRPFSGQRGGAGTSAGRGGGGSRSTVASVSFATPQVPDPCHICRSLLLGDFYHKAKNCPHKADPRVVGERGECPPPAPLPYPPAAAATPVITVDMHPAHDISMPDQVPLYTLRDEHNLLRNQSHERHSAEAYSGAMQQLMRYFSPHYVA